MADTRTISDEETTLDQLTEKTSAAASDLLLTRDAANEDYKIKAETLAEYIASGSIAAGEKKAVNGATLKTALDGKQAAGNYQPAGDYETSAHAAETYQAKIKHQIEFVKAQSNYIDFHGGNNEGDYNGRIIDNGTDLFFEHIGSGNNKSLSSLATTAIELTVVGEIFNAANDTAQGTGQATIIMQNGKAKIDFEISITADGTNSQNFDVGLNRDILSQLNSNIPIITPSVGMCTFMNNDGTINGQLEGYGGIVRRTNQFWQFGRIYDAYGNCGGWPSSQYKSGMKIKGVCYGTY